MNADDIRTTLRARAVFDASADRLDADTRRRLRGARLQALEGGVRPNPTRWMWPAGMATAAALALAVFIPYMPHARVATDAASVQVTTAPVATASVTSAPVNAASINAASINAASINAVPVAGTAASTAMVDAGLTASSVDATDPADVETADPGMLSELDFYGWLAHQQDDTNHIGG